MAWGWLANLLSPSAVDTTVKTVADIAVATKNGVDVMFYTDEEKAQANQKAFELWLDLNKTWQEAATPMAIARRQIAKMVVFIWGSFLILGVVAIYTKNDKLLDYIQGNMVELTWLMVCIFGFYYGPYAYNRYVKTK